MVIKILYNKIYNIFISFMIQDYTILKPKKKHSKRKQQRKNENMRRNVRSSRSYDLGTLLLPNTDFKFR